MQNERSKNRGYRLAHITLTTVLLVAAWLAGSLLTGAPIAGTRLPQVRREQRDLQSAESEGTPFLRPEPTSSARPETAVSSPAMPEVTRIRKFYLSLWETILLIEETTR